MNSFDTSDFDIEVNKEYIKVPSNLKINNTKVDITAYNLDRINVVYGESSTGKSYMTDMCKLAKSSGADGTSHIVVYDYNSVYSGELDLKSVLDTFKGKLIIIDNGDLIIDNDIKQHIEKDHNNRYIIMARALQFKTAVPGLWHVRLNKEGAKCIVKMIKKH